MKWILTTLKTKWKNPLRLSTTHFTLNPLNKLPNYEDRRGRGNSQNPYLSIQNGRNTNGKNKPFWKQKAWEVGVSSADGLNIMWHIPAKLSSVQSRSRHQERTLIFMIVLSWGGVSPRYRLYMYYFLWIHFLSLISESFYHLTPPHLFAITGSNG